MLQLLPVVCFNLAYYILIIVDVKNIKTYILYLFFCYFLNPFSATNAVALFLPRRPLKTSLDNNLNCFLVMESGISAGEFIFIIKRHVS